MRSRKRPSLRSQAGQATIEFALTMILLFAFVLFFIQLSLTMAWSSYVQYATFMSARALLSAGPSVEDQEGRAASVLGRMVKRGGGTQDRFPSFARGQGGNGGGIQGAQIGPGGQFVDGERNSSWMIGVRYTFKSRLFLLPAFGANAQTNSVTFTSETWMGREPSFQECLQYMQQFNGLIDNGC